MAATLISVSPTHWIAVAMLLGVPFAASAQDGGLLGIERSLTRIIERAEPAVVAIARVKRGGVRVEKPNAPPQVEIRNRDRRREQADPFSPDFVPNGFGTGIIVAGADDPRSRFVLTCYHVVRGGRVAGKDATDGDRLFVRFTNRRGCDAEIVAADPRSDLAVLRLNEKQLGVPLAKLPVLKPADKPQLRKGRFVVALGNPYAIARDGSPSASWGFISNLTRRAPPVSAPDVDERKRRPTMQHLGNLLHVDTRLMLGTSGGPLLDLDGNLIGLTTSLAALDGYEKSAGFAIPFDAGTKRVVADLLRGLEVEYGFLGVAPVDVRQAEMRSLAPQLSQPAAARLIGVYRNSPAALAGLKSGDLVLEVDGRPVYDQYDLMRLVGQCGPSAKCRLTVWREVRIRPFDVTVVLGKWPIDDDEDVIATSARDRPWRGLTVDYPTARSRYFQFPFRYHAAVVVTAYEKNGTAADLRPGDFITHVNDTPVQTPDEFYKAVQSVSGEVTLHLIGRSPVKVASR